MPVGFTPYLSTSQNPEQLQTCDLSSDVPVTCCAMGHVLQRMKGDKG